MNSSDNSQKGRIHSVNATTLHDLFAGGNPGIWDNAKEELKQKILAGVWLRLVPSSENGTPPNAPLISTDGLIKTVEQFEKWINAFESSNGSSPSDNQTKI